MNEHESEQKTVPGLSRLRRDIAPARELWPGIQARLKPRRAARSGLPPWLGFALAASLLLMVALPLRFQSQVPRAGTVAEQVPSAAQQVAYLSGQLKVIQGAEDELLFALQQKPQSPVLRRLLESTRQRQRDLRRLVTAHV